jgi:hypothetical protein
MMGMILNIMEERKKGKKEQPSTGVAEAGGQVFITKGQEKVHTKKATTDMGTISSSGWSMIESLETEAGMLNRLVDKRTKSADNVPTDTASGHSAGASATPKPKQSKMERIKELSRSVVKGFTSLTTSSPDDEAFDFIEEATGAEKWDEIEDLLDDLILLINTDTGGQAEFLNLHAALVQGPSLNLLFSRLVDDLERSFEVYYTNQDGKSTKKTHSTKTVEEVLFQCLACIASYSGTFGDGPSTSGKEGSESKVMFVGTFRDQVNDEQFKEKDRLLQKTIENTLFYKRGIIEFAAEGQLMLAVNNMSGDQAEIDEIREVLVNVIKNGFKEIEIPTSWLVFSLQMRRKKLRTMSLDACKELAKEVKIDPTELQDILWFLHHHVGVLLYYPEVPALRSTVICDIQVVFDSASNLIKSTFTCEKHVNQVEITRFRDTAQFSLKNVKDAVSEYIPLKALVELLQYLGILTIIPSTSSVEEEPTYFMPCVLNKASELGVPISDPAPLLVCYDCGYVPIGVFPSLIINLVSQQERLRWKMIEKDIYKNKVEFRVGDDYDIVTLISHPRYLEIVVHRSDASLCSDVRMVIQSTLKTATFRTNYHFSMPYKFGFECPSHPGREHLCICEKTPAKKMLCLKDLKNEQPVDLESRHKVWFSLSPSERKLVPDLEFLTLFKWKDAQGVQRELRITSTVSDKWRDLGSRVGLITAQLERFKSRSLRDNDECCVHVFTHWYNNDGYGGYPLTWKGLYDLLCDIKHKKVAKDLEAALGSCGVSIHV